MAISKSHSKKSPSQNPVDFYHLKQAGGAEGKSNGRVPDKLNGGKLREKVYGTKGMK